MTNKKERMHFSQQAVWRNGGINPAYSHKFAPFRLQTQNNCTFAAEHILKESNHAKQM